MSNEKILVIGAGPAGLSVAKSLKEKGLNVVVFEQSDEVGGNWKYRSTSDPFSANSAAYQRLHTNTPKELTAFSDYPFPKDLPDHPTHYQVAGYLRDYAQHFNVYPLIHFYTRVTRVRPITNESGQTQWVVSSQKLTPVTKTTPGNTDSYADLSPTDNPEQIFDAIGVCNGHNWHPLPPAFDISSYSGECIHSHSFRHALEPIDMTNKRILVVGLGHSGTDIIKEASTTVARQVISCSSRWTTSLSSRNNDMHTLQQDFPFLIPEGHPSVDIKSKPVKAQDKTVYWEDGSKVEGVDAIIMANGYQIDFPFFDEKDNIVDIKLVDENVLNSQYVELFKFMFTERWRESLCFFGLSAVQGSLHPIAEAQGKYWSKLMAGECTLPENEEMERSVKSFVDVVSKFRKLYRVMDVDPEVYKFELNKLAEEYSLGSARPLS